MYTFYTHTYYVGSTPAKSIRKKHRNGCERVSISLPVTVEINKYCCCCDGVAYGADTTGYQKT